MKANLQKQPWITLCTNVLFAWITFSFSRSMQQSSQVDHASVEVFKIYGFLVIGLLVTLTAWTVIKTKLFSQYFVSLMLLILNVSLYSWGLHQVEDLPYQQRFILKNDTPFSLHDVKLIGEYTIIQIGTIQTHHNASATYYHYIENTDIDFSCDYGLKRDTVNLVSGLTNSIGYIHNVKIRVFNGNLNATVTR